MSGTRTVRPATTVVATGTQDVMDTSYTDADPENIHPPPERGIEGVNRMMIEAPPSFTVPEKIRMEIVPNATTVWCILMAANSSPYPFVPEVEPDWQGFMDAVRQNVTASVNAELQDAAGILHDIQQWADAQTRLMNDANTFLSHQMQDIQSHLETMVWARQSQVQADLDPAVANF